MLRTLLLALLLLNGGLLAAHFGAFGDLKDRQREPERQRRQVQPQLLRLVPPASVEQPAAAPASPALLPQAPGAAAPADALNPGLDDPPADAEPPAVAAATGAMEVPGATIIAAVRTACLVLQPLHPDQTAAVLRGLRGAGLTDDAWRIEPLPGQAQHHVLMGPYANRAVLVRKTRELARREVTWTELRPAPNLPPGLAPGLSLGRYASADTAAEALRAFTDRGVRTADVVSAPPLEGLESLQLLSLGPTQWPTVLRLPTPANTRWAPCPGTVMPDSAENAPTVRNGPDAQR